jgi:hypothetical protein
LAGSIAAKPRFEPPLLVAAIAFLLTGGGASNVRTDLRVHMLIKVSEQQFRFD